MHTAKIVQDDILLISQPQLIKLFGEKSARLISQLHYWSSKENMGVYHEGKKWIFTTFDYLSKTLCMSSRQAQRIVSKLVDQGILIVNKLARQRSNRTNYYYLNYRNLQKSIEQSNHKICYEISGQNQKFIDDKMSTPLRHSDVIYNTKITNKDVVTKSEYTLANPISKVTFEQGQQVKKEEEINSENQKNSTPSPTSQTYKNHTAQKMLTYWNSLFDQSRAQMSKDLARLLVAAFKIKFNSNLVQWNHYCKTIESSRYLMGNSFHLSIYWALKFVSIDRIKGGDFGVQSFVPLPISEKDLINQIKCEIASLNETDQTKNIRLILLKKYGSATYRSWFKNLELNVINNNIHFKAPNEFQKDWILRNYPEIKTISMNHM